MRAGKTIAVIAILALVSLSAPSVAEITRTEYTRFFSERGVNLTLKVKLATARLYTLSTQPEPLTQADLRQGLLVTARALRALHEIAASPKIRKRGRTIEDAQF